MQQRKTFTPPKNTIMKMKRFGLLLTLAATLTYAQGLTEIRKVNGFDRLMVDGKPIVLLSGELHNSTSSTSASLDAAMCATKAMGLNSLIVSVAWEQIEPSEDTFDFSCVDNILAASEKYEMPLTLIWFGTWKNGESSYPPVWVKRDFVRFFRAEAADGTPTNTISPFCEAACKADAKAFARLMAYIRDNDKKRWIQVIQVENEIGVFLDRDHCKSANKSYKGEPNAEFMAKAYARYINKVAKAGKKELALPMYANCWLPEGAKTGEYPLGGPSPELLRIYQQEAPEIDFLSPDIYADDFRGYCAKYSAPDNLLFIPESQRVAGLAYYAFGEQNAQCYSPFAIEDIYNDPYLLGEYRTLGELLPTIARLQCTGRMHGFVRQKGDKDESTSFTFDGVRFTVHYISGERHAHGLVAQVAPDEYICAGVGAWITIEESNPDSPTRPTIGYAEEVEWKDGDWSTKVVLNGDQTFNNRLLYLRGRMTNEPYREKDFYIPAPWTDVSHQRIFWKEWQNRYKVSGIYRIKLYDGPKVTTKFP